MDNAMTLIPQPPWAPEQYVDFFNTAVAEALKFGLTSIHDAATDPGAVTFFKGFGILRYCPLQITLNVLQGSEGWETPCRNIDYIPLGV